MERNKIILIIGLTCLLHVLVMSKSLSVIGDNFKALCFIFLDMLVILPSFNMHKSCQTVILSTVFNIDNTTTTFHIRMNTNNQTISVTIFCTSCSLLKGQYRHDKQGMESEF